MTTERVRDLFFPPETRFSRAEDRAFAREGLIYNVTEDLLVLMEQQGVSKKELARRLGRSRSYVTQLLSGTRNMTLGTLSDICFALGTEPRISVACNETPTGDGEPALGPSRTPSSCAATDSSDKPQPVETV